MALTLVVEDGSGKADANTYVSLANANAYHAGHLHASAWNDEPDERRKAALVMAARLIDSSVRFNGYKFTTDQALQWPRGLCPDPDQPAGVFLPAADQTGYVPDDEVPKPVADAAAELARQLLKADRTDNEEDSGLKSLKIAGAIELEFDSENPNPILPALVMSMLSKYGSAYSQAGTVKLRRA